MTLSDKKPLSKTRNLPYAIVIIFLAMMIGIMTVIVSLSIKEAEKKRMRQAALRTYIEDGFAKSRAAMDKQFEPIRRDRGRWGT